MTEKQYTAPVLTEQQMAEFLMNHYSSEVGEEIRNDYRRRSLALLEEIHEPAYAIEVRRIMETMYKKAKKARKVAV